MDAKFGSSHAPIGWPDRPMATTEIPGSPITRSAPPTRFPKNKVRILLLENVHQCAIDNFHKEGFFVETAVAISEEARARP